ncbi:uncharacterized protein CTRU02_203857 [Colletotrichum truncatum]|uniref:Uncharacterized protein n=1 Tax=Colletotrichum truncatum TaxID=5467 RepID=A0ACC3ZAI1_COLTU|nr:uncharacterized protein CTRU02_04190 [Colletotrichum truncatum]KAF6796229.1 hypothetical protein CTRU02_04190 [Colletotrichum truncatum]
MATPITRSASDEQLSSPDPLNDTVSSALYPSSRRMTRSQRSQRLFSIGGSSTSPRKQTFELEVGDNRAPQRLLVTVEAEDEYENVGRRLFNAQTPSLRRGATTTTIPLGGDRRVTAIKTPARRGRPPKNGTPGPSSTATRKRAATPRKTPRQSRKPKIGDSDDINSELTISQGTPKSILRRTTRASSRQPRESSADPAPSTTRKRGRPRRVDFNPDETVHTIEEDERQGVAPSDDGLAAGMEEMAVDDMTPAREQPIEKMPDSDHDIWMETLDDEATPRPTMRTNTTLQHSPPPAYLQEKSPTPSEQLHSEAGDEVEYNDYDFGPGPASDISSLIGDGDANGGLRDREQDTVAQGEDFSMIFANSIPSLRGNMSVQTSAPEDFGEETSLIINRTLESLRQSGALRLDDEEDEVVGVPTERTVEVYKETTHIEEDLPSTRIEALMDSIVDLNAEANTELIPDVTGEVNVESIVDISAVAHSPVELPELPTPRLRAPSISANEATPSKTNQSPTWTRSSPRRKSIPLGRKLLESKARQMDDSFSSIPSKILAAATPGKKASRRSSMANEEVSVMYEDEFSDIPESYLEAATPGRALHQVEDAEVEDVPEAEPEDDVMEERDETVDEVLLRPSPTKSTAPSNASVSFTRSDSGRMLTPDDTPSPNDIPAPESDGKTIEAPHTSPLAEHSHLAEEMSQAESQHRSSSPMIEQSHLPERSSSPIVEQSHLPERSSSPIAEQSHLPERSSSPVAEESQLPETRCDIRNGGRSSSLPVGDLTTNLPAAASEYITPVAPASSPIPSPDANLLAPRAASPENGARPTLSPIVRAGRALQSVTSDASSPPRQNSLGSPFRPTTSSSQPQSASKSRNSWTNPLSNLIQAGAQFFQSPTRQIAQPPAQAPQSSGQHYDDPFGAENNHVGQRSFMEALAKSMRSSSPVRENEAHASFSGSLRVAPADEIDEMSWMHEEPAPREQPFAQSRSADTSMEAIGESMDSQQPSFENQVVDPAADETEVEDENTQDEEDDEDIWAVEASRPASQSSHQQALGKQSIASISAPRAALPSPWMRRAESPNKQTIFTPAASHNRKPIVGDSEAEDFSMLSQQRSRQKQIPQKAFQISQQPSGKKDLSAFFSSPALLPGTEGIQDILEAKKRQNAVAPEDIARPSERFATGLETNSMFPSIPQKAFNPSASGRSDLFSPAKSSAVKPLQDTRRELFSSTRSRGNVRHPSEIPDSQPAMSDEITFPSVAQKKNFTPRSGQKTNNLFSKTSAPVPSLTPVRMQLTRADIKKWQEDSASAIAEDSPQSPRQSLRPLPDRNMSPSKSCLRSPLKPRTPGRVVEFTSSVLSPLAQAQARAERRMSASSNGSAAATQQRNITTIEEDKENDVSEENEEMDVSMTDAPEASPPKPIENRLSQTMWSRDHWLLLDELIQLRRQGPFNFQWPAGFQPKSGWLLGKAVNSHGSSLVMEQWHLDVVDAFKAEVGGWEEEMLAKRVFSLIVGDQLRKEGRAPRAPSVKFA